MATAISDEQIIAALLSNGSIAGAAAAAGIAPRTLYDRMASQDFRVLYSAAKTDIVRTAVFAMQHRLTDAINTVAAIMADEKTPSSVRLQAAQVIINNACKFAERLTAEESVTIDLTNG